MRDLLINTYMFFRHPTFFWRYNIRKECKGFLINGSAIELKSKGLMVGRNVRFGHDTRVGFFGNGKLNIGNGCYFVNYNSFLVGADISIGNNCLFASNILVTSENHLIEIEADRPYENISCSPVSIGNGCWIGERVVILPGVTIGNKCVIGAGSVVTKSIPDYCIAVGNPARVVKQYDLEKGKWVPKK